jgi:gamma-glutamylcysteine synthetase
MSDIYNYFFDRFKAVSERGCFSERRIGAELKFPLVDADGGAASFQKVRRLWDFLVGCNWKPVVDKMTGNVVGAKYPGSYNDTVASCETGFCKTEFSLAHVGDLLELEKELRKLWKLFRTFSDKEEVFFLGYGIQPVTPPSKDLLMKKGRSSIWDKVFPSNRHIAPEHGDDVHLFTINAASHVHVSVNPDEAVQAVNVLNGFAGAQIALTANSNIWKGVPDPRYKCVSEKLWDWWMEDSGRIGVPVRAFDDLRDYIDTVADFQPVFVMRDGKPVLLNRYDSFNEYIIDKKASGIDVYGHEVSLTPEYTDFDLHCTNYWYNARISRYFTVENRVNDQQPPEDLIVTSALTLGLISALNESWEEIQSSDWQMLRLARDVACRQGLDGVAGNIGLREQAKKMLDLARIGLLRRRRGEEKYLYPFYERIKENICPADVAAKLYKTGGIPKLVSNRKL